MENAAIGFRKTQPLRATGRRTEAVPVAHWLSVRYRLPADSPVAWVNAFLERSLAAVVADRHLLHASEVYDCISRPSSRSVPGRTPGQRDRGLTRRLPVAILRQFLAAATASSSSALPAGLADALDLGVRSFEGSLALLANFLLLSATWEPAARQGYFRDLALDFYTAVVQQGDPYWQGVPIPQDIQALDEAAFADASWLLTHGRLLWFVCHWRCHLAHCLRTRWHAALKKSPAYHAFGSAVQPDWLPHQSQLWADTHLDLMTYAAKTQRWQDAAVRADPLTARFYPAANHVLCDEELPDATALFTQANLWYEMHVKKEPESLTRAVTHFLISKTLNFPNQIRGFWSPLRESMARLPEFDALVKLILHTHLLGNSPLARSRLWMAARLRIHALFLFPGTLDARVEVTAADLAQLPDKDRTLQRKYPRTVLQDWILEHHELVYTLVREWMLYMLAQLPWLEEALGRLPSHRRFKNLVFECLRDCRNKLSQQARNAPDRALDWSVLVRYSNAAKSRNFAGLVAVYHEEGLRYNVKMRKGHFEELLLKKITNCKKYLTPKPPADLETLPPPLGPSEETFHMVCWWLALHGRRILDVRYFILLGMTWRGVDMLALWVSDYYVHDFSDNQLINMLVILYERCPRDLVILTRALQLLVRYRQDRPFYLPHASLVHELCAIRRDTFSLGPLEDTPDECDLRWYCEGCDKWANYVVLPPDWAFSVAPVRPGAPLTSTVRFCVPHRGWPPPPNQPLAPSTQQTLVSTANIRNAVLNLLTGKMHCTDAEGLADATPDDDDPSEWDIGVEEQVLTDVFDDASLTDVRLEAVAGLMSLVDTTAASQGRRRRETRKRQRHVAKPRTRETEAGRAFVNAVEGPLSRHFTCSRPLTQLNMAGVWRRRGGQQVGLCSYCPALTPVQNEKMTTRGLSCMRHRVPEFTAEHPIWFHAHATLYVDGGGGIGTETSAHAARFNTLPAVVNLSLRVRRSTNGSCAPLVQNMLQPHRRDRVLCAVCRRVVAKFFVLFYDEATLQLHLVPLCSFERLDTDVTHGRSVISLQALWGLVRESFWERKAREQTRPRQR